MSTNNGKNYVASEELSIKVLTPMQKFKEEVAAEIGLTNYNSMDKGWLASRQNGYVGGNMVKKMTAYAEQAMSEQGHQVMDKVRAVVEVSPEVRKLNEMASQNFSGYIQALQSGNLGHEQIEQGPLQ